MQKSLIKDGYFFKAICCLVLKKNSVSHEGPNLNVISHRCLTKKILKCSPSVSMTLTSASTFSPCINCYLNLHYVFLFSVCSNLLGYLVPYLHLYIWGHFTSSSGQSYQGTNLVTQWGWTHFLSNCLEMLADWWRPSQSNKSPWVQENKNSQSYLQPGHKYME